MVWDCLIVRLLWLHHIQSLANVTVTTIATGKVGKLFFFFGSNVCELEYYSKILMKFAIRKEETVFLLHQIYKRL
jgi:hypothetical protein